MHHNEMCVLEQTRTNRARCSQRTSGKSAFTHSDPGVYRSNQIKSIFIVHTKHKNETFSLTLWTFNGIKHRETETDRQTDRQRQRQREATFKIKK